MGLSERTAGWVSAIIYTGVALALSLAFAVLAPRVAPGDTVARYGGAGWVFLLAMIVLMPTFAPVLCRWLTSARRSNASGPPPSRAAGAEVTMDVGGSDMKLWPFGGSKTQTEKAIDPVCKMQVSPSSAAAKSEYKGKTYYFCAVGCKQAFDKEPQKYVTA
jgi:YHS domain-containing protein